MKIWYGRICTLNKINYYKLLNILIKTICEIVVYDSSLGKMEIFLILFFLSEGRCFILIFYKKQIKCLFEIILDSLW
jgi:hypothetical protein